MSQTAAHLVDHVIPHVPVRQWVHALKGVAESLGATALHAAALALEQALHGHDTASMPALTASLQNERCV